MKHNRTTASSKSQQGVRRRLRTLSPKQWVGIFQAACDGGHGGLRAVCAEERVTYTTAQRRFSQWKKAGSPSLHVDKWTPGCGDGRVRSARVLPPSVETAVAAFARTLPIRGAFRCSTGSFAASSSPRTTT